MTDTAVSLRRELGRERARNRSTPETLAHALAIADGRNAMLSSALLGLTETIRERAPDDVLLRHQCELVETIADACRGRLL